MESEHFVGKVAQKAIIYNSDKVLISRGKGDIDMWELPGGRLHRDEKPEDGLAREIREELGVEATIGALIYVEQFKMRNPLEPLHYFVAFEAQLVDPAKEFTFDPAEVTEAKWISQDDMQTTAIYDNCRRALEAFFVRKR